MKSEVYKDVFDALSDTAAEAANLKARPDLLAALIDRVKSWDLAQEQAAARMGITRLRLNDLPRGKLGTFSLDALVDMTGVAGLILEFKISEAK